MRIALILFILSMNAFYQDADEYDDFKNNEFTSSLFSQNLDYKKDLKKSKTDLEKERLREQRSFKLSFSDGFESVVSPPFKFKRKSKEFDCECGEYTFSFYDNHLEKMTQRTIRVNNSNSGGQKKIAYIGDDSKEYTVTDLSSFRDSSFTGSPFFLNKNPIPKNENGKWKKSFAQKSDQCKTEDISAHHPKLKDFLASASDQGDIGWCYGFTASDLMSIELGVPVSSIHASVTYKNNLNKNLLYKLGLIGKRRESFKMEKNQINEGGNTRLTLRSLVKNKKICAEEDLPFDADLKGTKELINNYGLLKTIFSNSNSKSKENKNLICNSINDFSTLHPELELSSKQLYVSLSQKMIDNSFYDAIKAHCTDEKLLKIPKLKIKTILKPRGKRKRTIRFFKKINSLLDRGKPIGVSYDSGHILTHGSGMHTSSIVGKKWKDGKCQYKVRNSWGKTCAPYSTKTVLECNKEEGAFWISEETLYKMSKQLDYIK